MAETFPNNPHSQNIDTSNRTSLWTRVKQNLWNRVAEPVGGILGNIMKDNARVTWEGMKDYTTPVSESVGHFRNSITRALAAVFSPANQLFGSGIGEILEFKPQDAGARTVVGAGASFIFARDSIRELYHGITKPFFGGAKQLAKTGTEIFDNTVFGLTRFTTGLLFGKKAASMLYTVQPVAPRMQTPWTRAAITNKNFDDAEKFHNADLQTVAHREDFQNRVYGALYHPEGEQPMPHKIAA